MLSVYLGYGKKPNAGRQVYTMLKKRSIIESTKHNPKERSMDVMSIIGWIVLGGLAGWVASMIAGTNARQGLLGNIVVGIIGAFIGGFLIGLIGGEGATGFNLWTFVVAVLGAVILLFIWKAITGRNKA